MSRIEGKHSTDQSLLITTSMDCRHIEKEVYELAGSQEPIAPLVKEALDVIDHALDAHGCAAQFTPVQIVCID